MPKERPILSPEALHAFIEFFRYWDFDDCTRHGVFLASPGGHDPEILTLKGGQFKGPHSRIFWDGETWIGTIDL